MKQRRSRFNNWGSQVFEDYNTLVTKLSSEVGMYRLRDFEIETVWLVLQAHGLLDRESVSSVQ